MGKGGVFESRSSAYGQGGVIESRSSADRQGGVFQSRSSADWNLALLKAGRLLFCNRWEWGGGFEIRSANVPFSAFVLSWLANNISSYVC